MFGILRDNLEGKMSGEVGLRLERKAGPHSHRASVSF